MATFNDKTLTAAATDWIPLVEYAHKKDISLSTLRRHIKAGKIPYKVDQGRYLLFNDSPSAANVSSAMSTNSPSLQTQLQQAREEIAELKTLIAFYEERTHHPRPEV